MSENTDKGAGGVSALDGADSGPACTPPPGTKSSTVSDKVSEKPAGSTNTSVNAEMLLAADDWEQRLADARAKREKALASKPSKPKTTKAPKPRFALTPPDGSGEVGSTRKPVTEHVQIAIQKDKLDGPKNTIKVPPLPDFGPMEAQEKTIAPTNVLQPRSTVTLAAAGVFGIGVGLALGVVLMVGLNGVLNPQQIEAAAPALLPKSTVTTSPAPQMPTVPSRLAEDPMAAPEQEMVVSRAAITPILEPIRARVWPAPEVAHDLKIVLARNDSLPSANNALTRSSGNDTELRLASLATPRLSIASAPAVFTARTQTLPFDLSSSELNVEMNAQIATVTAASFALPRSGSDQSVSPIAEPALHYKAGSDSAKDYALPLVDDEPVLVRAVMNTSALVDADTIKQNVSFSRPSAMSAQPGVAVHTRTAFVPQQDTLPFVGPPPERAPTLAETLGVIGDRAETVQLFVHAPKSIADDVLQADLGTYSDTGFAIAKVNRENFKISKTHIRYYTREDEKYAQALATSLGVRARDFVRSGGDAGRIEIWMEGRGTKRVATTTRRTTPRRAQPADPALQLRNSLIQKLRRGDHL